VSEVLRIQNLHKRFGTHHVLRGVDLTLNRGERLVLLGASGSGKSTLLRCVNFLELPTEGQVYLDGRLVGAETSGAIRYRESELCAIRTRIGMVFQQFNLFPHLTAEQNVMLGPIKMRGMSFADARRLAEANLERVGILEKAREYPSRLSGGQQQRVAIARALAMEPSLILFDEATSALDPELVGEVLLVIRKLADEGATMLIVTHELGFAYHVAHRIIFLHEGAIHEEGPPDRVLVAPRTERMRDFLKGHTMFRLPGAERDEKTPER
jgi:polar amino acid transport system ATP-binding protein